MKKNCYQWRHVEYCECLLSFLPNCFLSCRKPCPWLSMELSRVTAKLENCIPLLIMMQYVRRPRSSILPLWCFPPGDLCPLSRLAAQPALRTSGPSPWEFPAPLSSAGWPASSFSGYYITLVGHILQELPEKELEGKFVETLPTLKYHVYPQA